MKKIIFGIGLSLILFSCKVSDSITIDTVAKKEDLKNYHTFKMVDVKEFDNRNTKLTEAFQDRLKDYGFVQTEENPDFLIQSVFVTKEFIQQLGTYSQAPMPIVYAPSGITAATGGSNEFVINKGLIGKVIFLIQDAESLEISWMGVGTGLISTRNELDQEKLSLALDELIASID